MAQQNHTVYRTCQSCYWWDDKRKFIQDDCDLAPCLQRHVARLFGRDGSHPATSHNFGCIHHSAVPPEVVR